MILRADVQENAEVPIPYRNKQGGEKNKQGAKRKGSPDNYRQVPTVNTYFLFIFCRIAFVKTGANCSHLALNMLSCLPERALIEL